MSVTDSPAGVTTTDDGGWASIPNWLVRDPKITPQVKLLYVYLNSRVGRKGTCFPSLDTIATETGMSKSTVQRALKDLRTLGLVEWRHEVTPKGRRSIYRLSPHEGGCGHTDQTGVVSVTTEEEPVEEEPTTPPSPPQGGVVRAKTGRRTAAQLRAEREADPAFMAFYSLYPRHEAVADAYKAWGPVIKSGIHPDCIMGALRAQLPNLTAEATRDPERNFCPTPARWLRAERWVDEITPRLAPLGRDDPYDPKRETRQQYYVRAGYV